MASFDLKVVLDQVDISETEADTLYGHCKDGTLITDSGVSYVDFEREANSLDQAVRSAIADVSAPGIRAVGIEIDADCLAAATA